jgi:D-sedoheptulose 7-phosphate isomerase
MKQFIDSYLNNLIELLKNLDANVIENIQKALDKSVEKKSKIYIIGNGGSASTASHMANDLSIGLKVKNIRNFNVESLADNSAICTAIANDSGYENIFYTQILNKIHQDDVLIAISCSGNSQNIIKAVEYAKSQNSTIIGMTGFDGGKLRALADIKFHIPTATGAYGLVEDIHMILDHILYSYYISTAKKE